jgi:outer membrane receptor for ferric coprogen and ferric-rhodotorulic acid
VNARWWIAAGLLLFSGAAAQDREETETRTADEEEQERPRVEDPEYVEVNLSGIPGSSSVTTRLPVDFLLTPANVGTVTRALIEEQDDVMLSGALRNVSGVNVQTQSLVHDYFLIRGFDSLSSGLIMTDGVAEPEATFYNN